MSRDIAARLYEEIKALRPDWHDPDDEHGMMKVVVPAAASDPEPLRGHVRPKGSVSDWRNGLKIRMTTSVW